MLYLLLLRCKQANTLAWEIGTVRVPAGTVIVRKLLEQFILEMSVGHLSPDTVVLVGVRHHAPTRLWV